MLVFNLTTRVWFKAPPFKSWNKLTSCLLKWRGCKWRTVKNELWQTVIGYSPVSFTWNRTQKLTWFAVMAGTIFCWESQYCKIFYIFTEKRKKWMNSFLKDIFTHYTDSASVRIMRWFWGPLQFYISRFFCQWNRTTYCWSHLLYFQN